MPLSATPRAVAALATRCSRWGVGVGSQRGRHLAEEPVGACWRWLRQSSRRPCRRGPSASELLVAAHERAVSTAALWDEEETPPPPPHIPWLGLPASPFGSSAPVPAPHPHTPTPKARASKLAASSSKTHHHWTEIQKKKTQDANATRSSSDKIRFWIINRECAPSEPKRSTPYITSGSRIGRSYETRIGAPVGD
jgi:hypothetical protein